MNARSIFHVLIVFLGLWPVDSVAQQKIRLSLIRYTQSNGLPSYNVRQILKDHNGFLWIASQDGLARFDGKTFSTYTRQSTEIHRISAPDVRSILEDSLHHTLWVLPNDQRLDLINILDGNVVGHVNIPKYAQEDWNISMASCCGKLWVGSYCGLKVFDANSWKFMRPPVIKDWEKYPPGTFEANCIATDDFNNVWVCYTGYGIIVYRGTDLTKIAEIPLRELGDRLKSGSIRFNDYAAVGDYEMVFATSQGLRKITYSRDYRIKIDTRPVRQLPVLNESAADAVRRTGHDEVIVAGNGHLFRFDSELRNYAVYEESLGESESEWINYVQSIYMEGDHIWLSCQQGVGLIRQNGDAFQKYYYDPSSGNKLAHLRSICVLPNKNILCGMSSGLMEVDAQNGRFRVRDTDHLYHHVFTDYNGSVILCRSDGAYILNGNRIDPISETYPEFRKFHTVAVNSHVFLPDSVIILGSENDNGILIWNYRRHTLKRIDEGSRPALGSNTVNNIYFDHRGRLWVLSDKVITVLDRGLRHAVKLDLAGEKQFPRVDLFFDICECSGSYWIAAYGNGIIQLNKNLAIIKRLGMQDGLANEGVYNIFNVGDSSLVVTSNNGLSVYHPQSRKFTNFYSEDGLQSNAFEEVTATVANGKIYAGGINGFSIINPSKFSIDKTPPAVYFKTVAVKLSNQRAFVNTSIDPGKITIPSDWLQASISFVGINFDAPKRIRYAYRIKEVDTSWINNGNRDAIDMIGVKPGSYSLEVRAANPNGYWSKVRSLQVVIRPKWFETWWFRLTTLAVVVLIINGIYHYRLRQIQIRQGIRRDIANDLHDDLGGNLNSIKMLTHLAKEKTQQNPYLNDLEVLISATTSGLRDMLWVLDDTEDHIGGLLERIKKFSDAAVRTGDITITYTIEASLAHIAISKTEKKNLFLIAKECINNSLKYAQCRHIDISVGTTKTSKRYITISDDGIGFDLESRREGYGLGNLKYRAEQVGYRLDIRSAPGDGTVVALKKK